MTAYGFAAKLAWFSLFVLLWMRVLGWIHDPGIDIKIFGSICFGTAVLLSGVEWVTQAQLRRQIRRYHISWDTLQVKDKKDE